MQDRFLLWICMAISTSLLPLTVSAQPPLDSASPEPDPVTDPVTPPDPDPEPLPPAEPVAAVQPAAEPPPPEPAAEPEPEHQTPDRFEIEPHGFLQADGRFFLGNESEVPPHAFLLRRVRPSVDGRIGDWFAARIVLDIGTSGAGGANPGPVSVSATLVDAYADFTPFSFLGVRFGKTKSPFGIERLQSSANRILELSIANQLGPNRDVGVMLFG